LVERLALRFEREFAGIDPCQSTTDMTAWRYPFAKRLHVNADLFL
jgi:hypothetical protein